MHDIMEDKVRSSVADLTSCNYLTKHANLHLFKKQNQKQTICVTSCYSWFSDTGHLQRYIRSLGAHRLGVYVTGNFKPEVPAQEILFWA